MNAPRMHHDDLRALMAALIYGQGLQLIQGAQWQNVNDYRQTVNDVDQIFAALAPAPDPTADLCAARDAGYQDGYRAGHDHGLNARATSDVRRVDQLESEVHGYELDLARVLQERDAARIEAKAAKEQGAQEERERITRLFANGCTLPPGLEHKMPPVMLADFDPTTRTFKLGALFLRKVLGTEP